MNLAPVGSVIFRSPLKADERATAVTQTIINAIPAALMASRPGAICTRSPNATMPGANAGQGSGSRSTFPLTDRVYHRPMDSAWPVACPGATSPIHRYSGHRL